MGSGGVIHKSKYPYDCCTKFLSHVIWFALYTCTYFTSGKKRPFIVHIHLSGSSDAILKVNGSTLLCCWKAPKNFASRSSALFLYIGECVRALHDGGTIQVNYSIYHIMIWLLCGSVQLNEMSMSIFSVIAVDTVARARVDCCCFLVLFVISRYFDKLK